MKIKCARKALEQAKATFFLDIIFRGSLTEVVACQEQHAAHKVSGRDSSCAFHFPADCIRKFKVSNWKNVQYVLYKTTGSSLLKVKAK